MTARATLGCAGGRGCGSPPDVVLSVASSVGGMSWAGFATEALLAPGTRFLTCMRERVRGRGTPGVETFSCRKGWRASSSAPGHSTRPRPGCGGLKCDGVLLLGTAENLVHFSRFISAPLLAARRLRRGLLWGKHALHGRTKAPRHLDLGLSAASLQSQRIRKQTPRFLVLNFWLCTLHDSWDPQRCRSLPTDLADVCPDTGQDEIEFQRGVAQLHFCQK